MSIRKYPKPYELKSFAISRRIHLLESMEKFFGGQFDFGVLSSGKVTQYRRGKLEDLIVELSGINETEGACIVSRPAESLSSRYVLLNSLNISEVKSFVHDKGYHNHEGAVIIQVEPNKFQIWLNLGRVFNAKQRKAIISYFTQSVTIPEWGFSPCFLNVHDDWHTEYDNHFYIKVVNGKSFLTTAHNNIKYKLSDNLIKHIATVSA